MEKGPRMTQWHHRKLPDYSTLLSGPVPPDDVGFVSERLQIWYNHTTTGWKDDQPHAHREARRMLHRASRFNYRGRRR